MKQRARGTLGDKSWQGGQGWWFMRPMRAVIQSACGFRDGYEPFYFLVVNRDELGLVPL